MANQEYLACSRAGCWQPAKYQNIATKEYKYLCPGHAQCVHRECKRRAYVVHDTIFRFCVYHMGKGLQVFPKCRRPQHSQVVDLSRQEYQAAILYEWGKIGRRKNLQTLKAVVWDD